ncbi:MAG: GNAT family N-acetyltransferase [Ruthenibacterium sp.]
MKAGLPGRQAPAAPKQGPVTLRAVTPEDAPLYCRWMKDAFVAENYGGADVDFTEEMARGFFASRQGKPSFLILARPGGRPVGFCELAGLDETVRSATLGMFIGEAAARGRGLGAAALDALLEYGFGALGLHSVWLSVWAGNARLWRCTAAQASGRPAAAGTPGAGAKLYALVYMDLLAEEFFARQKAEGAEGVQAARRPG